MTDDDSDRRFGFTLPPIRLPPLFPEGIRVWLPAFGRPSGTGNRLLAAIVLDAADTIALLTLVGAGSPRVAVGTVLAVVIAGPSGIVYAWELAPVAVGPAWLGLAPTATLLLLWRRIREVDLLGARHPEVIDREPDAEGDADHEE